MITNERKTMFNLADVCRALDIKNAADTKQRLRKRGIATTDTPTHNQFGATELVAMTYITKGKRAQVQRIVKNVDLKWKFFSYHFSFLIY